MKRDVDHETRQLIERAVSAHLDGHEIRPCIIAIDEDDPDYIEVGLCYEYSKRPIDSSKTLDMLSAIRKALVRSGDFRIPYVEHYFDEKQKIKGMAGAC